MSRPVSMSRETGRAVSPSINAEKNAAVQDLDVVEKNIRKLHAEFRKEHLVLPYYADGNVEFYTEHALAKREYLSTHPKIIKAINKFWALYPKDDHVHITAEYYISGYLKMTKALYKSFDLERATEAAYADWERDKKQSNMRHGQNRLNYNGFRQSLFEVADIWTDSLSAFQYVEFLNLLYEAVTEEDESRVVDKTVFRPLDRVQCLNFAMKIASREELDLPPASPRDRNPFARWNKAIPDGLSEAKKDLIFTASPSQAAGKNARGGYNARVEFLKQLLKKQEENEAEFQKLSKERKIARMRNALRLWWCCGKLIAYRHALRANRRLLRSDDVAEAFVAQHDQTFAQKREERREARKRLTLEREQARTEKRELKHIKLGNYGQEEDRKGVRRKGERGIKILIPNTPTGNGSDSYDYADIASPMHSAVSEHATLVVSKEQSEWEKMKQDKEQRMKEAEETMEEVQRLRAEAAALTAVKDDEEKFDFARFMQENRDKELAAQSKAAGKEKRKKTKKERQQEAHDKKFNKFKWLKKQKAEKKRRKLEEQKAREEEAMRHAAEAKMRSRLIDMGLLVREPEDELGDLPPHRGPGSSSSSGSTSFSSTSSSESSMSAWDTDEENLVVGDRAPPSPATVARRAERAKERKRRRLKKQAKKRKKRHKKKAKRNKQPKDRGLGLVVDEEWRDYPSSMEDGESTGSSSSIDLAAEEEAGADNEAGGKKKKKKKRKKRKKKGEKSAEVAKSFAEGSGGSAISDLFRARIRLYQQKVEIETVQMEIAELEEEAKDVAEALEHAEGLDHDRRVDLRRGAKLRAKEIKGLRKTVRRVSLNVRNVFGAMPVLRSELEIDERNRPFLEHIDTFDHVEADAQAEAAAQESHAKQATIEASLEEVQHALEAFDEAAAEDDRKLAEDEAAQLAAAEEIKKQLVELKAEQASAEADELRAEEEGREHVPFERVAALAAQEVVSDEEMAGLSARAKAFVARQQRIRTLERALDSTTTAIETIHHTQEAHRATRTKEKQLLRKAEEQLRVRLDYARRRATIQDNALSSRRSSRWHSDSESSELDEEDREYLRRRQELRAQRLEEMRQEQTKRLLVDAEEEEWLAAREVELQRQQSLEEQQWLAAQAQEETPRSKEARLLLERREKTRFLWELFEAQQQAKRNPHASRKPDLTLHGTMVPGMDHVFKAAKSTYLAGSALRFYLSPAKPRAERAVVMVQHESSPRALPMAQRRMMVEEQQRAEQLERDIEAERVRTARKERFDYGREAVSFLKPRAKVAGQWQAHALHDLDAFVPRNAEEDFWAMEERDLGAVARNYDDAFMVKKPVLAMLPSKKERGLAPYVGEDRAHLTKDAPAEAGKFQRVLEDVVQRRVERVERVLAEQEEQRHRNRHREEFKAVKYPPLKLEGSRPTDLLEMIGKGKKESLTVIDREPEPRDQRQAGDRERVEIVDESAHVQLLKNLKKPETSGSVTHQEHKDKLRAHFAKGSQGSPVVATDRDGGTPTEKKDSEEDKDAQEGRRLTYQPVNDGGLAAAVAEQVATRSLLVKAPIQAGDLLATTRALQTKLPDVVQPHGNRVDEIRATSGPLEPEWADPGEEQAKRQKLLSFRAQFRQSFKHMQEATVARMRLEHEKTLKALMVEMGKATSTRFTRKAKEKMHKRDEDELMGLSFLYRLKKRGINVDSSVGFGRSQSLLDQHEHKVLKGYDAAYLEVRKKFHAERNAELRAQRPRERAASLQRYAELRQQQHSPGNYSALTTAEELRVKIQGQRERERDRSKRRSRDKSKWESLSPRCVTPKPVPDNVVGNESANAPSFPTVNHSLLRSQSVPDRLNSKALLERMRASRVAFELPKEPPGRPNSKQGNHSFPHFMAVAPTQRRKPGGPQLERIRQKSMQLRKVHVSTTLSTKPVPLHDGFAYDFRD